MKPTINFDKQDGLVPAIIQDYHSKIVYMLGYINKEALKKTEQSGYLHFWSRSRNKIWMKGEESGNKLKVVMIQSDCDKDALLIQVTLEGTHVCHTGSLTCFDAKNT
jgi:phosphoribosyl-AMP cyclohydrolase